MRWLVLSALMTGLAAQGDVGAPPPAVQVDVTVNDARGRPVESLPPDAFRLAGGTPPAAIDILDVRFVAAPRSAADAAPPPPIRSIQDERDAARRPGARVIALYLDEYHVSPASSPAVREAVSDFVRDRTAPGDLLLVMKPLDSLLELRLTTDRGAVLSAVATFQGRRGDYEPRNRFEREMVAGDPARVDVTRSQIALSAIQALTTHLARLPDIRKSLVVVSEGFDAPPVRRGGAVAPTADGIARMANRYAVAIYAFEPAPSGGVLGENAAEIAPIRRLAAETGGRSVRGALADGFAQLADDLSGYYLLTLRAPADGRFHALNVRVGRPGVTVRSRRGFWTVSPEDLAVARLASAPPPPRRIVAPVRTSRLIRPWFGQSRGDDGRTRITLVWEPASGGIGIPVRGLPPSRLVVKATADDGTPVYEGTLAPATADRAGVGARANFDVPPGRVRLEMTIEDAAARVLDTDVRDVLVRGLAGPLVIGTPAVFRARTARAFNELRRRDDAAPSPARDFSRVERLLIRVPIYAAAGEPVVAATLTNRAGHRMRALPVTREEDAPVFAIDLPLASLAAGEYNVVVGVRARADDVQDAVKETVSFRVTP